MAAWSVAQQSETTSLSRWLHPALAFGAVIAGGLLYSAIGAFLALPTAGSSRRGPVDLSDPHEVMDADFTREQPPPSARAAKAAPTTTPR